MLNHPLENPFVPEVSLFLLPGAVFELRIHLFGIASDVGVVSYSDRLFISGNVQPPISMPQTNHNPTCVNHSESCLVWTDQPYGRFGRDIPAQLKPGAECVIFERRQEGGDYVIRYTLRNIKQCLFDSSQSTSHFGAFSTNQCRRNQVYSPHFHNTNLFSDRAMPYMGPPLRTYNSDDSYILSNQESSFASNFTNARGTFDGSRQSAGVVSMQDLSASQPAYPMSETHVPILVVPPASTCFGEKSSSKSSFDNLTPIPPEYNNYYQEHMSSAIPGCQPGTMNAEVPSLSCNHSQSSAVMSMPVIPSTIPTNTHTLSNNNISYVPRFTENPYPGYPHIDTEAIPTMPSSDNQTSALHDAHFAGFSSSLSLHPQPGVQDWTNISKETLQDEFSIPQAWPHIASHCECGSGAQANPAPVGTAKRSSPLSVHDAALSEGTTEKNVHHSIEEGLDVVSRTKEVSHLHSFIVTRGRSISSTGHGVSGVTASRLMIPTSGIKNPVPSDAIPNVSHQVTPAGGHSGQHISTTIDSSGSAKSGVAGSPWQNPSSGSGSSESMTEIISRGKVTEVKNQHVVTHEASEGVEKDVGLKKEVRFSLPDVQYISGASSESASIVGASDNISGVYNVSDSGKRRMMESASSSSNQTSSISEKRSTTKSVTSASAAVERVTHGATTQAQTAAGDEIIPTVTETASSSGNVTDTTTTTSGHDTTMDRSTSTSETAMVENTTSSITTAESSTSDMIIGSGAATSVAQEVANSENIEIVEATTSAGEGRSVLEAAEIGSEHVGTVISVSASGATHGASDAVTSAGELCSISQSAGINSTRDEGILIETETHYSTDVVTSNASLQSSKTKESSSRVSHSRGVEIKTTSSEVAEVHKSNTTVTSASSSETHATELQTRSQNQITTSSATAEKDVEVHRTASSQSRLLSTTSQQAEASSAVQEETSRTFSRKTVEKVDVHDMASSIVETSSDLHSHQRPFLIHQSSSFSDFVEVQSEGLLEKEVFSLSDSSSSSAVHVKTAKAHPKLSADNIIESRGREPSVCSDDCCYWAREVGPVALLSGTVLMDSIHSAKSADSFVDITKENKDLRHATETADVGQKNLAIGATTEDTLTNTRSAEASGSRSGGYSSHKEMSSESTASTQSAEAQFLQGLHQSTAYSESGSELRTVNTQNQQSYTFQSKQDLSDSITELDFIDVHADQTSSVANLRKDAGTEVAAHPGRSSSSEVADTIVSNPEIHTTTSDSNLLNEPHTLSSELKTAHENAKFHTTVANTQASANQTNEGISAAQMASSADEQKDNQPAVAETKEMVISESSTEARMHSETVEYSISQIDSSISTTVVGMEPPAGGMREQTVVSSDSKPTGASGYNAGDSSDPAIIAEGHTSTDNRVAGANRQINVLSATPEKTSTGVSTPTARRSFESERTPEITVENAGQESTEAESIVKLEGPPHHDSGDQHTSIESTSVIGQEIVRDSTSTTLGDPAETIGTIKPSNQNPIATMARVAADIGNVESGFSNLEQRTVSLNESGIQSSLIISAYDEDDGHIDVIQSFTGVEGSDSRRNLAPNIDIEKASSAGFHDDQSAMTVDTQTATANSVYSEFSSSRQASFHSADSKTVHSTPTDSWDSALPRASMAMTPNVDDPRSISDDTLRSSPSSGYTKRFLVASTGTSPILSPVTAVVSNEQRKTKTQKTVETYSNVASRQFEEIVNQETNFIRRNVAESSSSISENNLKDSSGDSSN